MKEDSSTHYHRLPDTCIMRAGTQHLNPQSFTQQEPKQVPNVTEEKGETISSEFGSIYCNEEGENSMSNSEIIEQNAAIPKEFRNINIFDDLNERTIRFKHWCLSRMRYVKYCTAMLDLLFPVPKLCIASQQKC